MNGESDLIKELSGSNKNIQKQLMDMREETFHDNIAMIIDYFIQNLKEMDKFLMEKTVLGKKENVQDMKMYESRKVVKPDPESLQSVLQFISSTLGREHEIAVGIVRKSGIEKDYLENYCENIMLLMKKADNMYHDLVER